MKEEDAHKLKKILTNCSVGEKDKLGFLRIEQKTSDIITENSTQEFLKKTIYYGDSLTRFKSRRDKLKSIYKEVTHEVSLLLLKSNQDLKNLKNGDIEISNLINKYIDIHKWALNTEDFSKSDIKFRANNLKVYLNTPDPYGKMIWEKIFKEEFTIKSILNKKIRRSSISDSTENSEYFKSPKRLYSLIEKYGNYLYLDLDTNNVSLISLLSEFITNKEIEYIYKAEYSYYSLLLDEEYKAAKEIFSYLILNSPNLYLDINLKRSFDSFSKKGKESYLLDFVINHLSNIYALSQDAKNKVICESILISWEENLFEILSLNDRINLGKIYDDIQHPIYKIFQNINLSIKGSNLPYIFLYHNSSLDIRRYPKGISQKNNPVIKLLEIIYEYTSNEKVWNFKDNYNSRLNNDIINTRKSLDNYLSENSIDNHLITGVVLEYLYFTPGKINISIPLFRYYCSFVNIDKKPLFLSKYLVCMSCMRNKIFHSDSERMGAFCSMRCYTKFDINKCDHCSGGSNSISKELIPCEKCSSSFYCSYSCKEDDLKQHNKICNILKK